MTGTRMSGHGLERGPGVAITVNGVVVDACEGETIAVAVMAASGLTLRHHETREPRGYFCGMGVCFDCVMTVDGVANTRTCVTWVRDGMSVDHQNPSEYSESTPLDHENEE